MKKEYLWRVTLEANGVTKTYEVWELHKSDIRRHMCGKILKIEKVMDERQEQVWHLADD